MTIRVVIVDDHLVVREGVKALLGIDPNITVVGEGTSAASALAVIVAERPQVVVTDIKLGDGSGLEVCRQAKAALPGLRVIVLSAHWTDRLVLEAFEARADGYMLKSTESFDLAKAVAAVARGETIVAPALAEALFRSANAPKLTARERELIALVVRGRTNQEIAAEMSLSPHTVKDYLSKVLLKFGATNRTELSLLATQTGLVEPAALRDQGHTPIGG